jgi:hypothetical protein
MPKIRWFPKNRGQMVLDSNTLREHAHKRARIRTKDSRKAVQNSLENQLFNYFPDSPRVQPPTALLHNGSN